MSIKKVLVCPLDWGLGHATRCIPLIHALINEGAEVIIAADNGPLALLKEEFPALQFIRLKGYTIHYSKRMSMAASMLLQSPQILFNVFLECRHLKNIIRTHGIDCVISDNRYGLWNERTYSVFITHQLSIKCPSGLRFLEPLIYKINSFFINKYDECWIPDSTDENNLSGKLSHKAHLPKHARFIGWLSRFEVNTHLEKNKKNDLLVIISGPEPHRTLLLETILTQLNGTKHSVLIVSGEPQKDFSRKINERVQIVSHLNSEALKQAIMQSGMVICRAGYSGIMDMAALKKNAILIPTPGQTEQEYLAHYLHQKKLFYSVAQKDFKLEYALKESHSFGDFSKTKTEKEYLKAIKLLMRQISSC